jgi:hypothetical protein
MDQKVTVPSLVFNGTVASTPLHVGANCKQEKQKLVHRQWRHRLTIYIYIYIERERERERERGMYIDHD